MDLHFSKFVMDWVTSMTGQLEEVASMELS